MKTKAIFPAMLAAVLATGAASSAKASDTGAQGTAPTVKAEAAKAHKPAASQKATATAAAPKGYKTIIGEVKGIVCAFCVQGVQKRFKSLAKADEVIISLQEKKVIVSEKNGQVISDQEFRQAIKEAGFETESIQRSLLPMVAIKRRLAQEKSLFLQAEGGSDAAAAPAKAKAADTVAANH